MIEYLKKRKSTLLKKLMFAYVTGLSFMSTITIGHAQVGELVQAPTNKIGSELDTMMLPAAVLLIAICGVLLIFQKKKVAGAVFVVGAIGIFIVKNRNTIGSFVKGL